MAIVLVDGLNMTIDQSSMEIRIPSDSLNISIPSDVIGLNVSSDIIDLNVSSDDIALSVIPDALNIEISGCTKVIPAGDTIMIKTAAENVGGHRIVTIDSIGDVLHADKDLIIDGKKAIGMTTQAALAGNQVIIAISGDEITEPSWNWDTNKPIYLGDDGVVTQVAPTVGFVLIVGVVLSPTSIRIRIEMPIFL